MTIIAHHLRASGGIVTNSSKLDNPLEVDDSTGNIVKAEAGPLLQEAPNITGSLPLCCD